VEIRSTKDHFERETEETERLIRPSPKVKPPRKDLRRERIEVDDEPEKHDKDAAAASIVARVLGRAFTRWAEESPKVKVRHRETGQTREVTKDFLQSENGRDYEPVKEGEEDAGGAPEEPKVEKPGEPGAKKPESGEPKHEKRKKEEQKLQALHGLKDAIDDDLALQSFTKSLIDPKSELRGWGNEIPLDRMPKALIDTEKNPAFKPFKTMGDLRQAINATKQLDKVEEKLKARWKEEDEAEPKNEKPEPAKGEGKPAEAPKGEGPTGGPPLEPTKEGELAESGKQLREMAKNDPAVGTFIHQFDSADPASFARLRQKMSPGEEIAKHLRGIFPKNVKTVGDFMNALKLSEPKAEPKKEEGKPPAAEAKPARPPVPRPTPKAPPQAAPGQAPAGQAPGAKPGAPPAAKPPVPRPTPKTQPMPTQPMPAAKEQPAPAGKPSEEQLAEGLKTIAEPPPEEKPKGKKKDEKSERPKVKPSEEEAATAEFIKGQKHKTPEFQDWADEDSSTVRDDSGEMLYPDEKKKKHVPFESLPPRAQADWVERFQRSKAINENLKGLREKAVTNPELSRTLKDLANPHSDLRERLKEQGGRLEYQSIKKSIPELRDADLPPGVKTVGDLLAAAAEMHHLPPQPSRREVTPEEQDKAKRQIIETMPADVAERLLESDPPLHPDDVRDLVETHSMAMGEKSGDSLIKAVEGHYETDPEKVRPPAKGLNRYGEEVPFEKLSEGEKADAMQKHRMFVLGMSLAAREKQVDKLRKKTNAPDELLGHIADFMLRKHPNETPEDRDARATTMAKHVFKDAVERGLMEDDADKYARWQRKREMLIEQHTQEARDRGEEYDESEDKALPKRPAPKEISEKQIGKLLDQLKDDPAAQRLAVGYAQANDYLRAQKEFLSHDSPSAISEHESPGAIVKGLKRIDEFFDKADKRYPKEMRGQIPAKQNFRNRVLDKIRTLAPEKYPFVNSYIKEKEYDEYEDKLKKWGDDYDKAVKKHKDRVSDPYRQGEGVPADLPQPPPRPAGYGQARGEPGDVKDARKQLYDRLKDQDSALKTASTLARVVARVSGVSTCKPHWAMGDSLSIRVAERAKAAVYWGVEPYPKDKAVNTPYVPWTQVHQRDLGEKDFDSLVKAAREWLKTPVLSTAMNGIYRETQVRAALELAIRDHENGRYSVGLQPPIYNMLLARLTGESDPYALLPDRSNIKGPITVDTGAKMASESLYHSTAGEGHPMKPSAIIRQFASKYASSNPVVAYDLVDLSMKVAEQEQQEESQGQQQKQAQLPPEFLEHQKGKKEDGEKKDEQGQGQQKDASYTQLRSAVIKMAAANPHLREAYRPLLETIKKLG
jgi:hypothetical protein